MAGECWSGPGGRGGAAASVARVVAVLAILASTRQLRAAPSSAGCRPPGSPALCRVQLEGAGPAPAHLAPDTVARYYCDPGYVLVGDARRVCQQDGHWSGSTPRCYINLAGQAFASTRYQNMLDGDLSTYSSISDAIQKGITFYNLPDVDRDSPQQPARLKEIRIVTDEKSNLTKWNISISGLSSEDTTREGESRPWFSQTFDRAHRQRLSNSDNLFEYIVTASRNTEHQVHKLSLTPNVRQGAPTPSAKVYEVRIVAESKGLTRHQCQLPGDPPLLLTWAAGDRCFHLVNESLTEAEAKDRCRDLGGDLAHIETPAVRRLVTNVLSHHSQRLDWSRMHFWVTARTIGHHIVERVKNKVCAVLKQIARWKIVNYSCQKREKFICQTDPMFCGTPAQPEGLRFQPRPGPQSLSASVTCPGGAVPGGSIECRAGRWTQPTFCQTAPSGRVLGPALGGTAAVLLLAAVLAVVVVRRRRRKRADGAGWEPYGFMQRIRRMSSSGRRRRSHVLDLTDNIYSDVIYQDARQPSPGRDPGSRTRKERGSGGRQPSLPLPPPPLPLRGPPDETTANPLYEGWKPEALRIESDVQYCVPLVDGRRQRPNFSLSKTPRDGATSASPPTGAAPPEGTYAVPWDSEVEAGQEGARQAGELPSVPDVVTSAMG